jgi:hypothetical protein
MPYSRTLPTGKVVVGIAAHTEHRIGDCKAPKDRARIEANKNAMMQGSSIPGGGQQGTKSNKRDEGKGKTKPSEGKYRPPAAEENNRRVIDGKPMFWRELRKRLGAGSRRKEVCVSERCGVPSSGSSTTSTNTTATTSSA